MVRSLVILWLPHRGKLSSRRRRLRGPALFRQTPTKTANSACSVNSRFGLKFRPIGEGKRSGAYAQLELHSATYLSILPVILFALFLLSSLPLDSSIYDYGCRGRCVPRRLEGLSGSFGRVKPGLQGCNSLRLDGSILRLGWVSASSLRDHILNLCPLVISIDREVCGVHTFYISTLISPS
jgi:hypothetical protein